MNYSFVPFKKYKEYKYFRYAIQLDKDVEETVYCKNDTAFLEFLNEMNNKNIWSKFYTKKDWDEQRAIHESIMKNDEMKTYERHLSNIIIRRNKKDVGNNSIATGND